MSKMWKSCNHSVPSVWVTIDSLPNELLDLILAKLTLKEKINVEIVCKKWSQVLKGLYCKQNSFSINCTDSFYRCSQPKHNQTNGNFLFHNYISYHSLAPIVNRCPNLKSIRLENCCVDSITLLWLLHQCPRLQCLALINIYSVWEIEWMAVKNILKQRLRHLVISDLWMKSQNLMPIIPFVDELVLHNHLWPMTKLMSKLGPNIRKISLIRCIYLKTETMKALVTGNGRHITHLSLNDLWIESEIIQLIGEHLQELEYLSIMGSHAVHLRPIVTLKKLKELELKASAECWANMLGLTLPNIQCLTLSIDFSPKLLHRIEDIFPKVQKLWIKYWFDNKTNDNLCLDFISKMNSLKYVSINNNQIPLK